MPLSPIVLTFIELTGTPMSDSPYIIEVNEQNFAQVIIEGSKNVPVVVDFWADWCNPCQTLMPILKKIAEEYAGSFILAKVNSDENQNLAAQLGVRSLPTVKIFKDGQPVDEFTGALPESQVKEFIDKHIEKPGNDLVERAMSAFDQGDVYAAKTLLTDAYNEDSSNSEVALALGQVCLAASDYKSAELVVNNLNEADTNSMQGRRLKGMLTLSKADTSDMDLESLKSQARENNESEARYRFAIKLALQNQIEEAIEELLQLMHDDREFEDDGARKCLITLFDVLGDDPLVGKYRRKMFNLLH